MTSSAPYPRARATRAGLTPASMTSLAWVPSSRAAQAVAIAWLPALTAVTPRASSSWPSPSITASAPRALNEPVRWNSSSLRLPGCRPADATRPPARPSRARACAPPVRKTGPPLPGSPPVWAATASLTPVPSSARVDARPVCSQAARHTDGGLRLDAHLPRRYGAPATGLGPQRPDRGRALRQHRRVAADARRGGAEPIDGIVLPGMVDLHSHAFQRALAGLTQRLAADAASFWTWRDTMYAFAATITPDEQRAIAAQLYVELLKGGYTSVVEFHYLHHQPDGSPYDEPAAMSLALHEAALEAGIALDPAAGRLHAGRASTAARWTARSAASRSIPTAGRGCRPAWTGRSPTTRTGASAWPCTRFAPCRRPRSPPPCRPLASSPASCRSTSTWPSSRRRSTTASSGSAADRWTLLSEAAELDHSWCLVHGTHLTDGGARPRWRRRRRSSACARRPRRTSATASSRWARTWRGRPVTASARTATWPPTPPASYACWSRASGSTTCAAWPRPALAQPHCGAALWAGALHGGAKAAGRPVGRVAPGLPRRPRGPRPDPPQPAGRSGDLLLELAPVRARLGGARRDGRRQPGAVRAGHHAAEAGIARAYRGRWPGSWPSRSRDAPFAAARRGAADGAARHRGDLGRRVGADRSRQRARRSRCRLGTQQRRQSIEPRPQAAPAPPCARRSWPTSPYPSAPQAPSRRRVGRSAARSCAEMLHD